MKSTKIVIFGAGMVGGSIALLINATIPAADVFLVDVQADKASGQASDIANAIALWRSSSIKAATIEQCEDVDIFVHSAGAAMKPGQTRLDLLETNFKILCQIIDQVHPQSPNAIHLLATNPVDVLTYLCQQRLTLPAHKVISTGTSLDTARLKNILAEELGIHEASINASVLGEHGDSSFVHWSSVTIGSLPLEHYLKSTGKALSDHLKEDIESRVRSIAYKIKQGKGVSHYGIASAVAFIAQSIINNSFTTLPVGTVHEDVFGIKQVCLSTPCVLSQQGAMVLPFPECSSGEKAKMKQSATILKQFQANAEDLAI